VDTGRLRASITYEVDEAEQAVYVGTNVSYAPKVELGRTAGAGKGDSIESDPSYESKPGHVTVKLPYPYLTPAAQNHSDEYRALVKKYLS
jgi:phage gpG-like protein